MERIATLIHKLEDQYHHNARVCDLLATTQLIEQELSEKLMETSVLGKSMISVFIPKITSRYIKRNESTHNLLDKEYYQLSIYDDRENDEKAVINESMNEPNGLSFIFSDMDADQQSFDPLQQVPTLSQQVINDTLQFSETHTEPKIRDLKKAINQEQKQVFIKELFMGDQAMYERSIKTINNFSIYPEAEYWIKRELKTKLGWIANDPNVELFDKIIKRRFV